MCKCNKCEKAKKFKDNRRISFLNAFGAGGALEAFTNFVKSHNELELCFRGNNNSVAIYRNNHIVWNIKEAELGKYIISISLNHARFTNNWDGLVVNFINNKRKAYYNTLKKEVLDVKKKSGSNSYSVGELKTDKITRVDSSFLHDSYKIIDQFFKDYFDVTNYTPDLFEQKYISQNKDVVLANRSRKFEEEKVKQQELYTYILNGVNSEYFAYDLEFIQPYPCELYSKNTNSNQPDMFAIKYENDGTYKLVLIEVKTKEGACNGTSGVLEHLKGMGIYINEKIFGKNLIDIRRQDAIDIIDSYKTLGLRGLGSNTIPKSLTLFFENNERSLFDKIEILFVFTDSKDKSSIKWLNDLMSNPKRLIEKEKIKLVKNYIEMNNSNVEVVFKKYENGKLTGSISL